MTKAKSAPHPFDKEPAEGSREIIERELKRQERQSASDSKKHGERKTGGAHEEERGG